MGFGVGGRQVLGHTEVWSVNGFGGASMGVRSLGRMCGLRNKAGYILADFMVSLLIMLIIIIVTSNFIVSSALSDMRMKKYEAYFIGINNKLVEIYNTKDWEDLKAVGSECINTDYGEIEVHYMEYINLTDFLTSRLKVRFSIEGFNHREYVVEKAISD